MAERIAFEDYSDAELCQEPQQNNLIKVDFRPVMQRIGEKGAKGWNEELGAFVISSLVLNDPELDENRKRVKFLQAQAGNARDELGIDLNHGWSGGPETIRILSATWTAEDDSILLEYVHPRNFRYQVIGYLSNKETYNSQKEIRAINDELYPTQE